MPIPNHLRKFFQPIGKNNSEFEISGKLVCTCSNDEFSISYPGATIQSNGEAVPTILKKDNHYFFRISVRCSKCNNDHLLFDSDFHGWDGFVCHDEEQAALQRPELINWKCNKCVNELFTVNIKIQSQGKEDFITEAGDEFNPKNWIEAFEWINIDLHCLHCNKTHKDWVSLETM